ncbi:50S ribosomal protein L6 [Candidatus Woesearchaeota archaeon]|nr:50S ribosomal protein L6 [Candidatus Woesearchaeota archaeon]
MKQDIHEELEISEGITAHVEYGIFSIKGAKGEVKKSLHNPKVKVSVNNQLIVFEAKKGTQREKRLIKAYIAHLKSMMRGVSQLHYYKLKICSGHFPMNVSVKGSIFEIKNFVGETVPRTLQLKEGVKVSVDGHFVIVESADKEKAGMTAAAIEKMTKRAAFDKRIFQDGIFIIEKDGKPIIK